MFIVITGLDGSGTSTIGQKLHELDEGSILVRTPSIEYSGRDKIDQIVRNTSQVAHYFYYLSSVIYMSDYIKSNFDYKANNVYCVRYLIDTVVSHRVAGLNIKLDYNSLNILKPDKTIFVSLDEATRQQRITERGKSFLDKVLDDDEKRQSFLQQFKILLEEKDTIYFNNDNLNVNENVFELYKKIKFGGI